MSQYNAGYMMGLGAGLAVCAAWIGDLGQPGRAGLMMAIAIILNLIPLALKEKH